MIKSKSSEETVWVQIPGSWHISYVTLGKLSNYLYLEFLYLENGDAVITLHKIINAFKQDNTYKEFGTLFDTMLLKSLTSLLLVFRYYHLKYNSLVSHSASQ